MREQEYISGFGVIVTKLANLIAETMYLTSAREKGSRDFCEKSPFRQDRAIARSNRLALLHLRQHIQAGMDSRQV
jgi:hypothetical protein